MSIRTQQLNSIILHDLANFIVQNSDESDYITTVLSVKTSDDAKFAKVKFNVFPHTNNNVKKALNHLNKIKNEIARLIESNHRLKDTPKLQFELDASNQDLARISSIYDKINREHS